MSASQILSVPLNGLSSLAKQIAIVTFATLLVCVLFAVSGFAVPAADDSAGAVTGDTVLAPEEASAKDGAENSKKNGAAGSSAILGKAASETSAAQPPDLGLTTYFRAIGALLLVVGLLYTGLWVLKRLGRTKTFSALRGGEDALRVLQQFHIGHKRTLVEVQYGERTLLLGVTDHSINLLTESQEMHDGESFETCLESVRSDSPSS